MVCQDMRHSCNEGNLSVGEWLDKEAQWGDRVRVKEGEGLEQRSC